MTCKILRLFINTLTADDKYSPLNRENSTQQIQMHLSQKQGTLFEFFSAFFTFTLNFETFQKRMTLKIYVFPKLRAPKKVVR